MQIKHLSLSHLHTFGQILSQCPALDSQHCKRRMEFTLSEQIMQYEANGDIVLDYVSGMSVLAIYRNAQTDLFYLDRVVMLLSGTKFSIFPMEDTCCVDILTSVSAPPIPTEWIPIASLKPESKGLQFGKIYTFLYQECTHNFYFRGEKHLPYELVYVDRGEFHNLVHGQDFLLKQQHFMIIDSNDWHTQFSDQAVSFLTISFDAADTNLTSITNKAFALPPQLRAIFRKMLSQDLQEPYSSDYLESLLKILLIELLQRSHLETTASLPASGHSENEIVDRTIQLISENIHRKLTLEDLASMVHVSVPYLYMLFQVHLNTSPGKYIAKIRMEECKVLLRSREFSMGQIAQMMEFSSLQDFSRQFKRICGMTPTQYVRSLRQ